MGLSALYSRHFHAVAGSGGSASTLAQKMNSTSSQLSSPTNRVRSATVDCWMARTMISPHNDGSGDLEMTARRISCRTAGSLQSSRGSSIGGEIADAVLTLRGHTTRRWDPPGIEQRRGGVGWLGGWVWGSMGGGRGGDEGGIEL